MSKDQLGLSEQKVTRLDKNVLQNDAAVLRNLVGFLNNPSITGAEVVPPSAVTEGPKGETIIADAMPDHPTNDLPRPTTATPAPLPVAATPIELPPSQIGLRLFFTGRESSKVVETIGATEFSISGDVMRLAQFFFGNAVFSDAPINQNPGTQNFLETIKAWGSGEISATYPITPARATFVTMIRSMSEVLPAGITWARFGKDEGFWIDAAVNAARAFSEANPSARVVVTGVASMSEFKYFQALGFRHWHCMVAAIPGAIENKLLTGLNNSVTKQISESRSGNRLHCIWIGPAMPSTNRIWTLQAFKSACSTVVGSLE